MKSKDKEFISNIKYSENKMAKKILRNARISKWIFYFMFLLETITYVLIVINMSNMNGLIFYSIIYIIFAAYLSIRYAEYSRKILMEAMQNTICPEGFLNLNLYNAKKLISNQRAYNYALNNIAYVYIQLGDLNKANEIIEYVEKRKVNIILKSAIIQNKMDLSFYNNDVKKFKEECKSLNSILKFLPRKYKKEALLNSNLKQAVINKNREEVNRICNELEKKKQLLNKVIASYYRGFMLEENNNKDYEKYYKFVAENGNNIMIANKAREKIKLEKTENIYKRKMHLGYKILNLILLLILITSTIFFGEYTNEITKISWETGEVIVLDKKISIPCEIEEFEEKTGIRVGEIDEYNFCKISLNENEETNNAELYVEDGKIEGINVDVSSMHNNIIRELIVFPNNITVNNTIEEIQKAYDTGKINFFMRDLEETISDDKYSYEFNYTGRKYSIDIKTLNGKVQSIFYFVKLNQKPTNYL